MTPNKDPAQAKGSSAGHADGTPGNDDTGTNSAEHLTGEEQAAKKSRKRVTELTSAA
jgi:hypothetical protein